MPVDADEALRRATLIRSDPSLAGVTRKNIATEEGGVEWSYFTPDGSAVDEPSLKQRWNSLGLPPAWTEVWIAQTLADTFKLQDEISKDACSTDTTAIGPRLQLK